MKQTIVLILAMTLLFACRQKTAVRGEQETIGEETPFANGQSCYQYIKGKDTATLTLNIEDKKANGDLTYSWFEKDKNTGTIAGDMHGDTVVANYTFNSEGKESLREVVFLKKGDKLLEGVGEVTIDGGKTLFMDRSRLTFGESVVFSRVACK